MVHEEGVVRRDTKRFQNRTHDIDVFPFGVGKQCNGFHETNTSVWIVRSTRRTSFSTLFVAIDAHVLRTTRRYVGHVWFFPATNISTEPMSVGRKCFGVNLIQNFVQSENVFQSLYPLRSLWMFCKGFPQTGGESIGIQRNDVVSAYGKNPPNTIQYQPENVIVLQVHGFLVVNYEFVRTQGVGAELIEQNHKRLRIRSTQVQFGFVDAHR